MAINLPHSDSLSTNCLSQIFNNTVASYKYYWFLAILDIHVSAGRSKISIWDIIITMISDAWYPIHYFKLSFGKSDSMDCAIREIRRITGLPYDADKRQIQKVLKRYMDKGDKDLKKQLKIFTLNVPYRFLMPWIKTSDNKEMMLRSQSFENNALYALNVDEDGDLVVQINPQWSDYLAQNYRILMDFAYWNLAGFLQTRNPSVPNIANKLIRPDARKSLARQHRFWDTVIELNPNPIKCIYTDKIILSGHYDLDHFIPWSFVAHDLEWNLMPSDPSINSSKSDKIPDLDLYLPKLALAHQDALIVYANSGRDQRALEDFVSLGYSVEDLVSMDPHNYLDMYYHTFSPIAQIARNMGYEAWQI